MPRYYFDINGSAVVDDNESETLESDEAAWHEATLVAGEIFKDVDGKFRPGQQWTLEVLDEQRRPLFSINITSQRRT
jgi:hypothetical protein